MRRIAVGAMVLLAGMGALLARVGAQSTPPLERPTTRTTDCTSGGCHSAQSDHKFLHGPNAVHACDACHEHLDPAKHTFELKRTGRQLCDFCHIDKTGTEGPVVHKPVATGECLGCHDPHGANNRRMLKKDTTPELCAQCHKEVVSAKHVHKPASEDCELCHKPHTSANEHLLTMDRRSLCLSCHQEVGKTIAGAKHPHDPTKGDCLQCHQAHASNEIKNLKAAPKDLCSSCHQKIADVAAHAKVPHGALTDSRACLNCHLPHGSEHDKQLAADPVAACMACHKDPIVVSKDVTVAGVPELADATLHRHGPIQKGDCAGCHTVHGGERDRLLVANYTKSFYQTYSEESYELCFKCHDKELILAQPATTQTGFRDGTRNLHAVHVKSPTQGRSCRACHSIHASKFEAEINETVQFGQWKLPINFKPTETGGSCAPGCHKVEKYERVKPAATPVVAPATQPPAKAAGGTAPGTAPEAKGASPAGGTPR